MTTFSLRESLPAGPPTEVATFEDPRVACIAAYRRCRMHGADPALDAQWTGVDALTDDGERIPLLELRRVEGGVRVDTHPLRRVLPALDPSKYFVLSRIEGRLMIEGPR